MELSEKIKNQQNAKQVIVVNKNLNMPQGKLAAQVSHASLGALLKLAKKSDNKLEIDLDDGTAVTEWINGRFTKIVLYVKSEEKLIEIAKQSEDAGLPTALITDAGFTVFDGVPTKTCVGIGPAYPEEIDKITKKLRVL